MNPWQRAFQAFQDAENLDEKHIRFDVKDIDKPELIINQFRSINLFPSYGLDKLLNIHLFHRFYLLFQPFIRRPDNVSLGLQHQSRELLRDGYYLVRVLILRNPKEAGDWEAVQNQDILDEYRRKLHLDENIDLTHSDYITHTDSVVRAKANFVNFYMPIYLATKQMYYIASRNIIVIQIFPADPLHIKYIGGDKEGGKIDKKRTKWKAFTGHELINQAYGGAINIQHWTNWNLLQPVDIDTDEIIENSEIGREYKHFDFRDIGNSSSLSEEKEQSPLEDCVIEELEKIKIQLETGGRIEEVEVNKMQYLLSQYGNRGVPFEGADRIEEDFKKLAEICGESSFGQYGAGVEAYKEEVEADYTSNILENYALENALKPIVLGTPEGEKFLQDLQSSFEDYQAMGTEYSFDSDGFFILDKHLSQFNGTDVSTVSMLCENGILCGEDITLSYLKALEQLSKEFNSLKVISEFVQNNKETLGSDKLKEELFDDCEDRAEECLTQKFELLIELLDIEFLGFQQRFTEKESFVQKQTFIFMLMYLLPQEALKFLDEVRIYEALSSLALGYSDSYQAQTFYLAKLKGNLQIHKDFILKQILVPNPLDVLPVQSRSLATIHQLSQKNDDYKDLYEIINTSMVLEENFITEQIDRGIKYRDLKNPNNLPLVKSLCTFWTEKFIKEYLDEDLKISTYTDYVRKFNYLQYLEHAYINNPLDPEKLVSDINGYVNLVEGQVMNPGERTCHLAYRTCVSKDYCSGSLEGSSKLNYCEVFNLYQTVDSTCSQLIKNECSTDVSQNLSLCHSSFSEESCNEEVRGFCRVNPDLKLCQKYENRCFKKYSSCLQEDSTLFQIDVDQTIQDSSELLQTCIEDFQEFFKLENKMIVHEVAKQRGAMNYNGGFLRNFAISYNNSIGSYMNWTAQRGRSLSVSADAKISPLAQIGKKLLSSVLSLNIGGSWSQHQSSNESNSGRRAWDGRSGEAVFLSIGKAEISVKVKKFQKCLVIKPRPNAFTASLKKGKPELYQNVWSESAKDLEKVVLSRPGLILCNPVEDREQFKDFETIKESYFYISQNNVDPSNSQFLDLYDLANRPFILILRGKREFLKFYHLTRRLDPENTLNQNPDNQFINHTDISEHTVGLTLSLREFNETGFYPGVYDYPYNVSEEIDASSHYYDGSKYMLNMLHPFNIFEVPSVDRVTTPIQQGFNR